MQTTASSLLLLHLNGKEGLQKAAAKVPALQKNCQDTSTYVGRGRGHSSQECFEQTKVMHRSTMAICFLQDTVSVQVTGEQHHIKPFDSGYQLVTRAGGRRKARV